MQSYTFLPPDSVCESPFLLLFLWFSVCFLRWGGGGLPVWLGMLAVREAVAFFGFLLISLFSLLGDFHHGNPIRLRQAQQERARCLGVSCVCVWVC